MTDERGEKEGEEDLSTPNQRREIRPETLQLIPKLLWFLFAVAVFLLTYSPLMDRLQKGQVAKVSFATFQIEFAQQEFAKAAGDINQKGGPPPKEFSFFADRIQREAGQLTGARALWISDNNPVGNFAERRALTSLGISFDLAKTTEEAEELLDEADRMNSPYDFIISDIHRNPKIDPWVANCFPFPNTPKEAGCRSVQVVTGRYKKHPIPFIFYSLDGNRNGTPTGALGATDRVDELLSLVLDAVERRQPRNGQPFAEEPSSNQVETEPANEQ